MGVEFYHFKAGLRFLAYAIGLKFSSEGVQTDTQRSGGAGFIVTQVFVNAEDVFFLDLIQGRNRIL